MAAWVAVILYRVGGVLKNTDKLWFRVLWWCAGGSLAALLLWGTHYMQWLPVPDWRLQFDPFAIVSLLLCAIAAFGSLCLLTQRRLSNAQLAISGLIFTLVMIASAVLQEPNAQWNWLQSMTISQGALLALCLVMAMLSFSASLWLPTQPKSSSLAVQSLQRWLSPIGLMLGLFNQLLFGLALSAAWQASAALGMVNWHTLLLVETLSFALVLLLLVAYGLKGRREWALQKRNVLFANAVGMMLCDYEGRILCVNDAFLEIVGYERSEMTERMVSWVTLTPAAFEPLDQQAIAELKSQGVVGDYEKQLIRKDGQCVDVLIAGLSRVSGFENTAMGYVLDITEKKKALLGISESEARFRQLADSNLIGVAFWNIYGSIYDANEVFLGMLGYTREELQAGEINWRNVILPQDQATQGAMVQQAIAGEKAEPYETSFLHRDGGLVHVQVGFAMLHGAREAGFSFVQDISERKQAEAALLENYQRINRILEAIPHKVWTAEPNGQSSYSNQNLLQYAGVHQEEMNRTGWLTYLHPEDLALTQAEWQTALATGQRFEAIVRLRHHDGHFRWHLCTAHPVYNRLEQLILWVGTGTDIHEMKLAQERIKESEARFRLMAEQSPIMIWLTNDTGEVTYINARLSAFMGLMLGSPPAGRWGSNINAEDEPWVSEVWQTALKRQANFEATFRQFRNDGEERWVQASGNPIHSVEGDFWGYVGTLVDITDQKRVQEKLEAEVLSRTVELQENMTLLHSVFENVPAVIFLKDAKDLRFKLMNKVGRELFGFVADEYMNRTDHDLFPKEQADFCVSKDRETLSGHQLVDIPEELLQTPRGVPCLLHMKKVPIFDKQGNPAYVLVVAEDITESKKAQDQILNLNLKLQEQVTAISAAHKALESFSYSVSHDLRAPLRTIDGYSQVVLENYAEQLDDTGKHYLSRVREGSQQMAKLIDDMLNLSRLSRSELKKEKVDLSELVRRITQEIQHQEPEREVEFIIQDGLMADADKRLIQSVLQNLVGNAWKFTSHHARAIIEFGCLHEVGKPVYFVRDDGAGFDMAYVDKLFGTFQRLHSAEEFPGNGIGLASAQRIIARHGGEIWAQGVLEQGATFYFSL